jgi:hypothetical protein
MASYQDVSPELMAKLFEDRVLKEFADKLNNLIQREARAVLDQAVHEAKNSFVASIESYRSYDRFGEDIRITLNDKRT